MGAAGGAARGRQRRMKFLPLPMFWRIFLALLVMTISALVLIAATFGDYQARVAAQTLAPTWAAAIRAEASSPEAASREHDVRVRTRAWSGAPPARAYSIENDGRTRALTDALLQSGISVIDVRLDDTTAMPVTWLFVQPPEGPARWVGLAGGLQPPRFRARAWLVIGTLLLVITIAAWFTSRWVARPMARLARQVDAIARGEVPADTVRGAREIERLGTALATMARQRAAFDSERRVMLMGVSHDLRSPLTRIRVAAELLDQQAPLRELIARNVEQADAIIESFLSYVRTDVERIDEEVDLSAVAMSAARLVDLPADAVAVSPGVRVRGNVTLLQRLVGNLIDNAQKHGAPPVRVAVRAERARRVASFSVEDHGVGLVDVRRMLQPFERGDASRAQGGAGLGLAIVARIVERHGGTLQIGQADGSGTRVVVELPLLGD